MTARTNREILVEVYRSHGLGLLAAEIADEPTDQPYRLDSVIVRTTLMAMNLAREDEAERRTRQPFAGNSC